MKNGTECVYPHAQEVLSYGRDAQWYDSGIDLRTYTMIEMAKALVIRSDGLIYTPEEVATRSAEITDTLLVEMI